MNRKGFGRKANRLSKKYNILVDGLILTRNRSRFFIEGVFNGAFDKMRIAKKRLKKNYGIDPDFFSDKIKQSILTDSEFLNDV